MKSLPAIPSVALRLRGIGCNVERPAYGQWPALSGEYLSRVGEKGERPEPRYPSPTRSRGSGSLLTGFSLLESNVGSGDRSPVIGVDPNGGNSWWPLPDRCRPEGARGVEVTRGFPPAPRPRFCTQPNSTKERPRPVFRLGPLWLRSCQLSRFAL